MENLYEEISRRIMGLDLLLEQYFDKIPSEHAREYDNMMEGVKVLIGQKNKLKLWMQK